MKRARLSLAAALLASLVLHGLAALLWSGPSRPQPRARPPIALDAVLLSPAYPEPAQASLFLPDTTKPADPVAATGAARAKPSPPQRARKPGAQLIQQAAAQIARSLLYPPEAIARGLEGETLVLLFLDESGNVVTARVERGSGHAILDEAAVSAARSVRSLPGDGAREVLLPVRFRLR